MGAIEGLEHTRKECADAWTELSAVWGGRDALAALSLRSRCALGVRPGMRSSAQRAAHSSHSSLLLKTW
jgi:hypothetical protein